MRVVAEAVGGACSCLHCNALLLHCFCIAFAALFVGLSCVALRCAALQNIVFVQLSTKIQDKGGIPPHQRHSHSPVLGLVVAASGRERSRCPLGYMEVKITNREGDNQMRNVIAKPSDTINDLKVTLHRTCLWSGCV